MAYALGESFLDSFEGAAPKMVAIDMDPTAHLVYGTQQLSLFNSYVGDSCLMPCYDGVTARLITAATLPELREKARYVKISSAGMKESAPHDVIEVAKRR